MKGGRGSWEEREGEIRRTEEKIKRRKESGGAPRKVVTRLDAALPPDQYFVGGAEAGRSEGAAGRVEGERVRARSCLVGALAAFVGERRHCHGAAHHRQPSGPTSSNRYSLTGRDRRSSLRRFFSLFLPDAYDLSRARESGRGGQVDG